MCVLYKIRIYFKKFQRYLLKYYIDEYMCVMQFNLMINSIDCYFSCLQAIRVMDFFGAGLLSIFNWKFTSFWFNILPFTQIHLLFLTVNMI